MRKSRIKSFKLRTNQCDSCPFKQDSSYHNPGILSRICEYLLNSENHVCHTTGKHICRGGRNYQLEIWARKGIIKEPTDTALFEAMRTEGIEPKYSELDSI